MSRGTNSGNLSVAGSKQMLISQNQMREWKRRLSRAVITSLIILILCSPAGSNQSQNEFTVETITKDVLTNQFGTAQGHQSYSSEGAPQPVTFEGVFSNDSQTLVMLDSSAPRTVSIQAPDGWSGSDLSGSLDYLSTEFRPLKNGLLDDYHDERYIIDGSPWNSEIVYVPDGWSILKNGDSTKHPNHGGLYWYDSAGSGREGSMGWRPSALFDTSKTLDPSMELYLSQELQLPWREVYSCQVQFYHRVPNGLNMDDMFHLFVEMGNYRTKFNVFSSGYTTDEWIQGTVEIPAAVFDSLSVPGSISLAIGLGTDFVGNPPSNIDSRVFIDQVEVVFEARPFPEQIGLTANNTIITSSIPGGESIFVPDGADRDCVSRSDTGTSTSSTLEIGVWSTSGSTWTDVVKYQTGFQFPLTIPRGAVITSAYLELEALGEYSADGYDNGFRVYVSEEDSLSQYGLSLLTLEDEYTWTENSIDWNLRYWEAHNRYRSPDLSALLQRTISRSGWSSGNYLGIMLDYMWSDNYRDYNTIKGSWGYSGDDLARLKVEYIIPQPDDSISLLQNKKDLTIDNTKVSSDLQDFPVLIDIFDTDLRTDVQPDGDDIRFMIGTEMLTHELELFDQSYNSSHAHLVAWVKVPLLSASTDTIITMCYGSEVATSPQNEQEVWNPDYELVHHLSESSGSNAYLLDSTPSENDAFPSDTLFLDSGNIAGARYFEGTAQEYIGFIESEDIFDGWSDWQFSFWIYFNFSSDADFNEERMFEKVTSMRMARTLYLGGITRFQVDIDFVTAPTQYLNVEVQNYAWNYIAMKYESTGDGYLRAYNYVNGALLASSSSNIGTGDRLVSDSSEFILGRNGGTNLIGGMDEFRLVQGGYRSLAWIQTEYANQYDPSSFLSIGGEQTNQIGETVDLCFSTTAQSVVMIQPKLKLNVTHTNTTLDSNLLPGTSFVVGNSTTATWTANVLIDPPPGVNETNMLVDKPTTWTVVNVTDSVGQDRTSEVTASSTQVSVPSSVVDTTGIWTFMFSSNNEVSELECGKNADAYGTTVVLQVGDFAKFRGTATIIPGSAMRLHLVDPSGQLFYSNDDLTQDGGGQFEWTGISVTSAWPNGIWQVFVDFNNTADSSPENVGRYNRQFIVQHGSSLQLLSPTDAVGDGVSVRTAGSLLEIAVQLTDTETTQNVTGSTVTMNWTVSGSETQIQLEDYGTGVYGKTLNTSDLGQPGNWRINIQSSHPYLVNTTTFFDLELSHPTILTYETPESTPHTDDFAVVVNLRDSITGATYSGASFASNGSIVGVTDYTNGTYLVRLDSTGLSFGTHCFQIDATPIQGFVLDSSVQVVFRYREIMTDLVQIGANPVSVPWGENAIITLEWQDIDHSYIGIAGGVLVGDGSFLYNDLLDGTYSIEIDVQSYNVGVYLFNFTITKANYQAGEISVAVTVKPHRTLVVATYDSSIPMGANASVSLTFLDLDSGNVPISDNLSIVFVDWTGGSASFDSLQFAIQTQDWAIGTYTIDFTVLAVASPRYYYDGHTAILLNVQKLNTLLTWDDIGVFPIGDDFEITTYVTVNESVSTYDGLPVNNLLEGYFTIRDKNGTIYNIKSFNDLGAGAYLLTLDQSLFPGGTYGIHIYISFGLAENFSNTQTPIISFTYSQARSDLSSPDYPQITISFSTDAVITLEFIDIDRGMGIDTATIYVTGAVKLSQQLISSGRYWVTLDTSAWTFGIYTVNFTASSLNYENKTISIDVQVRQIRTYAAATVGALEIPVGDSKSFYVDYIDMDHDTAIFTLSHLCNWTPTHYDIVWLGNRYQITINTYDSDTLGSYLLVFDFSAGAEYEAATFNVTVTIRTIKTELLLLAPIEDTTSSGQVQISVYYGDRDHSVGVVSSNVTCTVWNTTDQLIINWENDTSAGAGYYLITIEASQFGSIGIQQLTVFFNWTGSIQKFENKYLIEEVEILGEESELTLIDAALPSPCLDYMVYTFLYSSPSIGGISNDSEDVFISVEFIGVTVDLSQVDIWEIDSFLRPGEYSIGFNNSMLKGTGIFSMKVFINWSAGVWPYYTNRTDLISVRVLPRSALLSIVPPTNIPYGENVTFSFSYEDTTGGSSIPIDYDPIAMTVSLSVPDFTMTYSSLDGLYTISFNTSQFGAPLGQRTLILNLTWTGLPFYTNVTGRLVEITLTERQTLLTYPTLPSTPFGNNVTFSVVYIDIAGSTSKSVLNTTIEIFYGPLQIPASYVSIIALGGGEYQINMNTTYFNQPGTYGLLIAASSDQFYYQDRNATRNLVVSLRDTLLTAEPVGNVPYGSSFSIVLHYQDLDTLHSIGNDTGPITSLEILNGTDWLFTCVWRPALQNYLLTVETSNQVLELDQPYLLWLNFSAEYETPFYRWDDVLVTFQMRERSTSLDLISAPLQTHYQDYANFTILYKDILSSSGISGDTISIYFGLVLLEPAADYEISEIDVGVFRISVLTSVLGAPGLKTITVIANWSAGSPFYSNAQRSVNILVTERPTSVDIISPPQATWYLDNLTYDFAFVDISTGQRIAVPIGDVTIYSGGALLTLGDYTIQNIGLVFRVSINSTVIGTGLVSDWNITTQVNWIGGDPYYKKDATSVFVSTVGRIGYIELAQIENTALGDIMNLSLTYNDQRTGRPIEDASVVIDCVEIPGLIEGVDYWVQIGTGIDSGTYRILISTSALGNVGSFTFDIDINWNPSNSPYYGNISISGVKGLVREIQTSLTSELPTPSVVAFYQNVSFVVQFTDTDHGIPIDGAEGQIQVRYQSTGTEPSIWSVQSLSGGLYNITLNITDSLAVGLQFVIVSIDLFPYEVTQTSVVFGIRNRVAGLAIDVAPTNYAGYSTYVIVYLTDYDADDAPLAGATLVLTWGDTSSYIDLGDGRYNATLQTSNLDFGSQILTVQANLLHYAISPLVVEINLLAVPSELIVTWTGPRSTSEVYWGEPITIYAVLNDTLRNYTVSTSVITYDWIGGTGSFTPTGVPGNYTAILDTSLGNASDTIIVRIEGNAPNYIDATYQLVFRLLPRPMEVIPEGNRYVFTVPYGDTTEVIVYIEDSLDASLVTEANIAASWDLEPNLTLTEMPSRPGFYRLVITTGSAGFGSYEIQLYSSKHNYGNASVILIMTISKIQMVVWLDNVTLTYEYTPVYWSEIVRIGVYVLAPSLNSSYPFSTGLDGLVVTWTSPEIGTNGTLSNGILIGGSGYYYYDFNTSHGIAALHTFIISANPPNMDYERADNSTSIYVRNLSATIISAGSPEFVWGWTGFINVTYYDSFHAQGMEADSTIYSWAGGTGEAIYLGEGVYGIPINTSILKPGTYTISMEYRKANYDDVEIAIRVHVATVPTEVAILVSDIYRIGDTWSNLQIPYGDTLTFTVLYNDTNNARGIPNALFNNSVYSGPGIYENPLVMNDHLNGNYSFIFNTLDWELYTSISFRIQFMLENHTTAEFTFEITIIEVQTSLEIMGSALFSLNWGMNTTVWIYYSDIWPGHSGEGIIDAMIIIDNPTPHYATIEHLGPDISRPGYYQFRVTAQRQTGFAEVTIRFNKTYYAVGEVTLSISLSPSEGDIALQNMITYGSAFAIIMILGSIVWVRILRVPKMIRVLSGQIRQLRRGRMPKPAKGVATRQSLIAELFNEIHDEIGVKRKPATMPGESIIIEVPEIGELIVDLSILTGMTKQELDDFKFEISKMKLSQQTSFVREVISQEVTRVARLQNKSLEQVIEEVVDERRRRIGGAPTSVKPEVYEAEVEGVSEPEDKGIEFELQMREFELEEMAAELKKRGIPDHEIESFTIQARELPKDIVEMLLQSLQPVEKLEPSEEEIEHLSEDEIENLRLELVKREVKDREIDSIIQQARELPRELAIDFFKELEKPTRKKRVKKVKKLSKAEQDELRIELERRGVPKEEIKSIMKEAKTAPKDKVEDFLKKIEDREHQELIEEIQFEDKLSELEVEDLRKQLEQRGLPQDEIDSIVKQAKGLPTALIEDLLKSIDADLEKK